jgi:hypothetical protein
VKPATVIAWHHKGFRLFWTWKIRHGRKGRPGVVGEVRDLIRKMSRENPLWGASHIHGELLELGIEISETSMAKYMVRRGVTSRPLKTWRIFLDNHVNSLVSIDFFTVPTIRFHVLYVFVVLAHDRRRVGTLMSPRIPWQNGRAQQLRSAFPFTSPTVTKPGAPYIGEGRAGGRDHGGG